MKDYMATLLKVVVSGSILWLIFSGIDKDAFFATIKGLNPLVIVGMVTFFIALQTVSAMRWAVILRRDVKIKMVEVFNIYFIGFFFNNFLPSIIGGDVIKGYYIYKYTKRGDISVASIFMDRYAGFTALMILTAVSVFLGLGLIGETKLPYFFALLLGGYFLMSLVLWVDFMHGWAMRLLGKVHFYKLNEKIDSLYNILMSYKGHRDILIKIFAYSFVVQAGVILVYYGLALGLGMEVKLLYFFLFVPLATAASMIPISLSGLGLREGTFVYLFALVDVPAEEAVTLSLMFFVSQVLGSIPGGIAYIRAGGKEGMEPIAQAAQAAEEGGGVRDEA